MATDNDEQPHILAAFADPHINSMVGLLPPGVTLDNEAPAALGKAQRWLWRRWLDWWQWIADLKAEYNARVTGLCAGDAVDKNKKAPYELVSQNDATIMDMACEAWRPVQAVTDYDIIVRGTQVHTGDASHLEEQLAQRIGAVQDEAGRDAWPTAHFTIGGVCIYAAHRPETHGALVHTEGPGVARNKAYLQAAFHESGRQMPDVALFAHFHRGVDSGDLFSKPKMIFLPPFKLTDSYITGLGKAHRVVPVGGVAVICQAGRYQVLAKTFVGARRRQPWSIEEMAEAQQKRT